MRVAEEVGGLFEEKQHRPGKECIRKGKCLGHRVNCQHLQRCESGKEQLKAFKDNLPGGLIAFVCVLKKSLLQAAA